MIGALRTAYVAELGAAGAAGVRGDAEAAFRHLERAHILSQRYTRRHVHVHWLMLRLGASSGDVRLRGRLTVTREREVKLQ